MRFGAILANPARRATASACRARANGAIFFQERVRKHEIQAGERRLLAAWVGACTCASNKLSAGSRAPRQRPRRFSCCRAPRAPASNSSRLPAHGWGTPPRRRPRAHRAARTRWRNATPRMAGAYGARGDTRSRADLVVERRYRPSAPGAAATRTKVAGAEPPTPQVTAALRTYRGVMLAREHQIGTASRPRRYVLRLPFAWVLLTCVGSQY